MRQFKTVDGADIGMARLVRFSRVALIMILMGSAPDAFATTRWFQSTLAFVYPLGDGSFVLGFTQASPQCQSPNSPQYFYVAAGQNGVTADGAKAMLATALTAFALERSLSIVFDDATPSCYINRFSMQ